MEAEEYKILAEDQSDQSDTYSIMVNDRSSESECESSCHTEEDDASLNSYGVIDEEVAGEGCDPQEGPSGTAVSRVSCRGIDEIVHRESDQTDDETDKNIRLKDLDNYLKNFGPKLVRCENKLDEFTHQLKRMRPHLEKCENSLQRYGQQLKAIERQLDSVHATDEVAQANPSLETQTDSNEDFAQPPEAGSGQGSSVSTNNQQHSRPQSQNVCNARRLSRRPSFQMNDGLIRHWIRRRNNDLREIVPFNRYREERRRYVWRNDHDLREFRRLRASWRFQNVRHQPLENDDVGNARFVRYRPEQSADANRRRNESGQGFVFLENVHEAGGAAAQPVQSQRARRPRSNMSLRSINVFNFPLMRRSESNHETDDDAGQNDNGRAGNDGRDGSSIIRSWIMMNNYFQSRPLFFGQGDSKYMDGQFTMNRLPLDYPLLNGNGRREEHAEPRDQRPASRCQRNHHQHNT